jgi:probable phosphoglycerate mutase
MATTFLLIRHALADPLGKALTGRTPGVHVNATGRLQVQRLADWFVRAVREGQPDPEAAAMGPIAAVYSSPLERARQTAAPLARALNLNVQIAEEINEVEFGDWTGKSLAELNERDDWRAFTRSRSSAAVPAGERAVEVQGRLVAFMLRLCQRHPDQTLVLVSHADPLRAALVYFLGMPLDFLTRLEIAPASVSALRLDGWTPRVLFLNAQPWAEPA